VVVLGLSVGHATAGHNVPKAATSVAMKAVKAYQPCTVPTDVSNGILPACTAAQSGACTFLPGSGSGTFTLKEDRYGADNLIATADDADIIAKGTLSRLDPTTCPAGTVLTLVVDVRITTDQCAVGPSCTAVDLPGLPVGSCTVTASGYCTTGYVNLETSAPALFAPASGNNIEVRGIGLSEGSTPSFRGGVFLR
jgi:hypothetical protein